MENLHRDQIISNIHNQVFMAIGYASMCWDRPPTGTFQSEKARDRGDQLMRYISQYIICESDEVN